MISPSGPSMAEVVKMSLEENVTKAPAVKNDPSLHDKSSAATKPSSSNASTESDAHAILREQLGDSDGNLVEPGEMDELLQEISDALLLSQGFFLFSFVFFFFRLCIYLVQLLQFQDQWMLL